MSDFRFQISTPDANDSVGSAPFKFQNLKPPRFDYVHN